MTARGTLIAKAPEIIDLWRQGMRWKEIGAIVGFTKDQCRNVVAHLRRQARERGEVLAGPPEPEQPPPNYVLLCPEFGIEHSSRTFPNRIIQTTRTGHAERPVSITLPRLRCLEDAA
jgi:hypothetical protein